jgi:cell division septal protein FtsQ
MRTEYSIGSKNKYQKIRRSAMKKRHFSRGNVNEYFHKKSNPNTWQGKVVFFFFLFIFLYLIYFLFISNYFKINQVIIEGNEEISTLELKEKCNDLLSQNKFLFIKNDSYFLFDTKELEEELSKDYLFEELKIEKKYFSTIFINLKEKPHKLFYVIDDNSFLIDGNGLVISRLDYQEISPEDSENRRDKQKIIMKEIPKQLVVNQEDIDKQEEKIVKDHELYESTNSTSTVFIWENSSEGMIVKEVDAIEPQIEDVYPASPEVGSKFFSGDIVRKILYLDTNYNHKFGENRDYYEFEYDKGDFLIMLTKENFRIYFKLNEAIDSQLSNLYRYLIEEGNDIENIEYIDLRQNNQIIIK